MTWTGYLISIAWRAIVLASVLWACVVLIDPYDSIAFSLPLERGVIAPVDERHHPGLQPWHSFDGAIVGSSIGVVLNPKRLGGWLGGSLVNIGILAPEPWEVSAMLELFLRHQPKPRLVVFELAHHTWCRRARSPDGWKQGRAPLQDWFFDENPWNNLSFYFSLEIFDKVSRQLEYVVTGGGLLAPDEHHRRLPERPIEELRAVFEQDRRSPASPVPWAGEAEPHDDPARFAFGDHALLRSMFEAVRAETHRIVILAPVHDQYLPASGSADARRVEECKRRIVRLAQQAGRSTVLDLLFSSDITREIRNYSDPLHLNVPAAERVVDTIGATLRDGRPADGTIRILAN